MAFALLALALSWSNTLTASTLLTTAAPLAYTSCGGKLRHAALTIAFFLAGAALISAPSAALFRTVGRKGGFAIGCGFGVLGSLLACASLEVWRSPRGLLVASFFVGLSQGMGQFYRFAAVEVVDAALKSRAVTSVLAGGVVSAFLGPQLAYLTRDWLFEHEFTASFAVILGTNLFSLALLAPVRFPDDDGLERRKDADRGRPMLEILSEPGCVIAIATATIAHTSMVMLMTPMTLAMEARGFSFAVTSRALQLHFLAMFLPSLLGVSHCIERFGAGRVAVAGSVVFGASTLVLAQNERASTYVGGMMLCGLGWNVSFSAATVLLTEYYVAGSQEAQRLQGLNDLVLFGVAGLGSLASGVLYVRRGWRALVTLVAAQIGLFLTLLLFNTIRTRRRRGAYVEIRSTHGVTTRPLQLQQHEAPSPHAAAAAADRPGVP